MSLKSLIATSVLASAVLASPAAQQDELQRRKIIGGGLAEEGDFPYIVSLQIEGSHNCGGSLLNSDTVLTAAHCGEEWEAANMTVRAGSLNQKTGGIVVPVASITHHPGWANTSELTDIAIWKLEQALPKVPEIGYASISEEGSDPIPGTMATVAGWGATDVRTDIDSVSDLLMKVEVPILARDTCRLWHANLSHIVNVTNDSVCAGFAEGGKDSCFGDSGGPLIDSLSRNLIGVVSWGGLICAAAEQPGVYMRVDSLLSWIKKFLP